MGFPLQVLRCQPEQWGDRPWSLLVAAILWICISPPLSLGLWLPFLSSFSGSLPSTALSGSLRSTALSQAPSPPPLSLRVFVPLFIPSWVCAPPLCSAPVSSCLVGDGVGVPAQPALKFPRTVSPPSPNTHIVPLWLFFPVWVPPRPNCAQPSAAGDTEWVGGVCWGG